MSYKRKGTGDDDSLRTSPPPARRRAAATGDPEPSLDGESNWAVVAVATHPDLREEVDPLAKLLMRVLMKRKMLGTARAKDFASGFLAGWECRIAASPSDSEEEEQETGPGARVEEEEWRWRKMVDTIAQAAECPSNEAHVSPASPSAKAVPVGPAQAPVRKDVLGPHQPRPEHDAASLAAGGSEPPLHRLVPAAIAYLAKAAQQQQQQQSVGQRAHAASAGQRFSVYRACSKGRARTVEYPDVHECICQDCTEAGSSACAFCRKW